MSSEYNFQSNCRTVVNLANSLSTYVQSEGRRPDLKIIDEVAKMPNSDADLAVDNGSDEEENISQTDNPTPNTFTQGGVLRMFKVICIHWSGTSPDTINVNRWKYFRKYVGTG